MTLTFSLVDIFATKLAEWELEDIGQSLSALTSLLRFTCVIRWS